MNTRILYVAFLLAIPALVPGCAQVGHDFPMERSDDIRLGLTTMEEVRAIFGEPTSVHRNADGSGAWGYLHSVGTAFGTAKAKSLSIAFGPDGLVRGVTKSNTKIRPGTSSSTVTSTQPTLPKP